MTMLLMARVHFGEDERMVNEGPLVRGERGGEERVGGGGGTLDFGSCSGLPSMAALEKRRERERGGDPR
jgi:hypothetical protein